MFGFIVQPRRGRGLLVARGRSAMDEKQHVPGGGVWEQWRLGELRDDGRLREAQNCGPSGN